MTRLRLRRERLLAILAGSPLSQNHWALKLGLSRGHWSDLVNGKHPYPSESTRQRMVEVFGVPSDELFDVDEGQSATADLDFRMAIASRYSILQEIGHGGMGTVYLASDLRHRRNVALKVVSPEAASGIGTTALLEEVALVSRLHHPNILPLFDSGEAAGHPWYVMPWVEGGSLRDLLTRQGRLSLSEALPIVVGIADALTHAHERGLLHCDVKPENVLLHGGHAFVMDFGIARKMHSEAEEWAGLRKELDFSAGTPAYVSPEQASGSQSLDGRSDLYSLGCVVFEMLSGRQPFEGDNTRRVVSRRFLEPPPDLGSLAPELPPAALEAVRQAMARDPDARQKSPKAFALALRRAAHGASGLARNAPVVFKRWVRRALAATGTARLVPRVFNGLTEDLALAARGLRRSPLFSLGVVTSLGLGLGLGLPALDLMDRMFLRAPPHVSDADRVVRLAARMTRPEGIRFWAGGLSGLDYEVIRREARTLEAVAGWMTWLPSLGRGPDARIIQGVGASASYFTVLGVEPQLGRFFLDSEDVPGALTGPCVISHEFWQREFGGQDDVLGQTLQLEAGTFTVIGVSPPGFSGLSFGAVDVWVPLRIAAGEQHRGNPELWTTDRSWWLRVIAKRRAGVSPEAADAEAARLYRATGPRTRDPRMEWSLLWESIMPARALEPQRVVGTTKWMFGGATLLLVLVTANLLNLFVARTTARAREVAIRFAVGGGRGRVLRVVLCETWLLAFVAAGAALVVSVPATRAVRSLLFPGIVWGTPAVDLRVGIAAAAAALLIGTVVAIGSISRMGRIDPATLLVGAGSGRVAGDRKGWIRQALVGAQAAVFTALVAVAIAFSRSLINAVNTDVGFQLENLIVVQMPVEAVGDTPEKVRGFYDLAQERLRQIPWVEASTTAQASPWSSNRTEDVSIPGRDVELPTAFYDAVTPSYLTVVGLMLRAGRWLSDDDRAGAEPVVVVNETLARAFFQSDPAIGQCFKVGAEPTPCRVIVGIVKDHRFTGPLDQPASPAYFLPVAQTGDADANRKLLVRVRGDPGVRTSDLRRVMQSLRPDIPAGWIHPVTDDFVRLFPSVRTGAAVFGALGGLALLVGALGLYSVLSYAVIARRREYAIRAAIGGAPRQLLVPILAQGVALVAAGAAVGLVLVTVARVRVDPMLFQTRLADPAALTVVLAVALMVGLAAALGPARRAARTDPARILGEL